MTVTDNVYLWTLL